MVLVAGRVDPLRNVETVMVDSVEESLVDTPTTRYLAPATPGHDLAPIALAVTKILYPDAARINAKAELDAAIAVIAESLA